MPSMPSSYILGSAMRYMPSAHSAAPCGCQKAAAFFWSLEGQVLDSSVGVDDENSSIDLALRLSLPDVLGVRAGTNADASVDTFPDDALGGRPLARRCAEELHLLVLELAAAVDEDESVVGIAEDLAESAPARVDVRPTGLAVLDEKLDGRRRPREVDSKHAARVAIGDRAERSPGAQVLLSARLVRVARSDDEGAGRFGYGGGHP